MQLTVLCDIIIVIMVFSDVISEDVMLIMQLHHMKTCLHKAHTKSDSKIKM